MSENWAVVPFIGCLENTKEIAVDLMQQTVAMKILLVDNGSSLDEYEEVRDWARLVTGTKGAKLYLWRHNPPLPSLSATWNAALKFVWDCGGEEALVCNNDIRVQGWMFEKLKEAQKKTDALFVSAVNHPEGYAEGYAPVVDFNTRGGPDFSCYLITKAGWEKYPFDENFIPAYCEDLDMHRRYMLGGDGGKIFSVSLPYLHKDNGSGTLKSFSPERQAAFHTAVDQGSRRYYAEKWGGPVNAETFLYPFNTDVKKLEVDCGHVTTPELQAAGCRGGRMD